MRRARRVDHSLFIYFILTEEAEEEGGGSGRGGAMLAYWTAPLLSPVLARCSSPWNEHNCSLTPPCTELLILVFANVSTSWLCSFSSVIVPPHQVSRIQIMCRPEQIGFVGVFFQLNFLHSLSAFFFFFTVMQKTLVVWHFPCKRVCRPAQCFQVH